MKHNVTNTLRRAILTVATVAGLGLGLWVQPAAAQYYYQPRGGNTAASLSLAVNQQFGRDYTVIYGRFGGVFAYDFEATLGVEVWRGNSPEIYKLVPEIRYVSGAGQTFKPYAALFVTRTYYSNTIPSHNSFGVRGGLYYVLNPSAYIGAGLVHERLESCDPALLKDCSYLYPELTLHFRF